MLRRTSLKRSHLFNADDLAMALDPKVEAAIALHRFGLGPRPGALAAIASDPRGALVAELDRPSPGRITGDGLMSSGEAARAVIAFREAQRQARTTREPAQQRPRDGAAADAATPSTTRPSTAAPPADAPAAQRAPAAQP